MKTKNAFPYFNKLFLLLTLFFVERGLLAGEERRVYDGLEIKVQEDVVARMGRLLAEQVFQREMPTILSAINSSAVTSFPLKELVETQAAKKQIDLNNLDPIDQATQLAKRYNAQITGAINPKLKKQFELSPLIDKAYGEMLDTINKSPPIEVSLIDDIHYVTGFNKVFRPIMSLTNSLLGNLNPENGRLVITPIIHSFKLHSVTPHCKKSEKLNDLECEFEANFDLKLSLKIESKDNEKEFVLADVKELDLKKVNLKFTSQLSSPEDDQKPNFQIDATKTKLTFSEENQAQIKNETEQQISEHFHWSTASLAKVFLNLIHLDRISSYIAPKVASSINKKLLSNQKVDSLLKNISQDPKALEKIVFDVAKSSVSDSPYGQVDVQEKVNEYRNKSLVVSSHLTSLGLDDLSVQCEPPSAANSLEVICKVSATLSTAGSLLASILGDENPLLETDEVRFTGSAVNFDVRFSRNNDDKHKGISIVKESVKVDWTEADREKIREVLHSNPQLFPLLTPEIRKKLVDNLDIGAITDLLAKNVSSLLKSSLIQDKTTFPIELIEEAVFLAAKDESKDKNSMMLKLKDAVLDQVIKNYFPQSTSKINVNDLELEVDPKIEKFDVRDLNVTCSAEDKTCDVIVPIHELKGEITVNLVNGKNKNEKGVLVHQPFHIINDEKRSHSSKDPLKETHLKLKIRLDGEEGKQTITLDEKNFKLVFASKDLATIRSNFKDEILKNAPKMLPESFLTSFGAQKDRLLEAAAEIITKAIPIETAGNLIGAEVIETVNQTLLTDRQLDGFFANFFQHLTQSISNDTVRESLQAGELPELRETTGDEKIQKMVVGEMRKRARKLNYHNNIFTLKQLDQRIARKNREIKSLGDQISQIDKDLDGASKMILVESRHVNEIKDKLLSGCRTKQYTKDFCLRLMKLLYLLQKREPTKDEVESYFVTIPYLDEDLVQFKKAWIDLVADRNRWREELTSHISPTSQESMRKQYQERDKLIAIREGLRKEEFRYTNARNNLTMEAVPEILGIEENSSPKKDFAEQDPASEYHVDHLQRVVDKALQQFIANPTPIGGYYLKKLEEEVVDTRLQALYSQSPKYATDQRIKDMIRKSEIDNELRELRKTLMMKLLRPSNLLSVENLVDADEETLRPYLANQDEKTAKRALELLQKIQGLIQEKRDLFLNPPQDFVFTKNARQEHDKLVDMKKKIILATSKNLDTKKDSLHQIMAFKELLKKAPGMVESSSSSCFTPNVYNQTPYDFSATIDNLNVRMADYINQFLKNGNLRVHLDDSLLSTDYSGVYADLKVGHIDPKLVTFVRKMVVDGKEKLIFKIDFKTIPMDVHTSLLFSHQTTKVTMPFELFLSISTEGPNQTLNVSVAGIKTDPAKIEAREGNFKGEVISYLLKHLFSKPAAWLADELFLKSLKHSLINTVQLPFSRFPVIEQIAASEIEYNEAKNNLVIRGYLNPTYKQRLKNAKVDKQNSFEAKPGHFLQTLEEAHRGIKRRAEYRKEAYGDSKPNKGRFLQAGWGSRIKWGIKFWNTKIGMEPNRNKKLRLSNVSLEEGKVTGGPSQTFQHFDVTFPQASVFGSKKVLGMEKAVEFKDIDLTFSIVSILGPAKTPEHFECTGASMNRSTEQKGNVRSYLSHLALNIFNRTQWFSRSEEGLERRLCEEYAAELNRSLHPVNQQERRFAEVVKRSAENQQMLIDENNIPPFVDGENKDLPADEELLPPPSTHSRFDYIANYAKKRGRNWGKWILNNLIFGGRPEKQANSPKAQ